MQTRFSEEQLKERSIQESADVLRRCVHCGFCTATCPTFQVLGDEADSPRGRIWMMRDMLEKGGAPDKQIVTHIDRCLSCLSCRTTCPSGVDYMRLVDHARAHINQHYKRPLPDRIFRQFVLSLLVRPKLFRFALRAGGWAAPYFKWLPGRLGALVAHVPERVPAAPPKKATYVPQGKAVAKRVALLHGCATAALGGEIHHATIRVLNKLGVEVVMPEATGCCGALHHHAGDEEHARKLARKNVAAWREADVDAVIVNASGCGTTVKDYGHLLADDADQEAAKWVGAHCMEITEFLDRHDDWEAQAPEGETVVHHTACSMMHGQGLAGVGERVLRRAGYEVRGINDAHICCGSAGSYSLFQPEISGKLKQKKAANIIQAGGSVMASANLGCMTHLASALPIPTAHNIELVDWAMGGPIPPSIMAARAKSLNH